MRETRFQARDHREQMPSGAAILASGTAMDDLLDRLQNGSPTHGWEGDARLCLAYNRQTERWELWRCEHDAQYRLVGASKKGFPFPPNLIEHLVSRDGRRGYDLIKDMDKMEMVRKAAEDYKFHEAMAPRIEKLAWALRKDDRTGAGIC